jgi:hypothetical protein
MKVIVLVLLAMFLLVGCANENAAPPPDSDNTDASWNTDAVIPVDDGLYTVTGVVVADVGSLTRQTSPGGGSISGYGNGFISGTMFGPEFGGAGFVRVQVSQSDSRLAPVEDTVILKVRDTKATLLLPGDRVTFKCRHEYEAVAPVRRQETFVADKVGTWELDYCRLAEPSVGK